MKPTSKNILSVLALGMLCGPAGSGRWIAAQENTSIAGTASNTSAKNPDAATDGNGALPGDSHVRIVRLSDARGTLTLDRRTGNGFEQTMQNMPIVEGEKLKTSDGYAEVEFEDNSTLRLTPNSQVDFLLLALRSSGAKASTMNVVRGSVYVSLENTKGNEFLLTIGTTKMTVSPSTHLRLEVGSAKTLLSVFNGSVEVQRGSENTVVAKKESLTLDTDQLTVAKKIAAEPYDMWDKESNEYHARYSRANAFAGSGNSFGLSDLNYYGSFINAGGCGQIWQPYLASAAWSPYANGVWALYPGAGYSWVSPYPWGWLPYHSGAWSFCPAYGWGWQPGGNWSGLNNIASGGNQPTGNQAKPIHSPLRPGPPVADGARPSLVLSNERPLVFSKEDKPGSFVFQKDSAGMGVPRGSLGGLNKISSHVEQRGAAAIQVYAAAPGTGIDSSYHGESGGPVALRAGSPAQNTGSSLVPASGQGSYGGSSGTQSAPSYHGGVSSQSVSGPSGGSGASSRGGGTSPK